MLAHTDNKASEPNEYNEFRNSLLAPLARIEEYHRHLEMFNTILTEPTSKAKLPDFSGRIFKQNYATQPDKLSALPAELRMYILSELDDIDKAMFALACKANAAFVSSLNLKQNHVTAERKKAGSSGNSNKGSLLSRASISTRSLSKAKKFKLLYGMRNEMPQKYRLCFNCIRFVPTRYRLDKLGWSTQTRDYELKQKGGIARAMREGPRCPSCRAYDALQVNHASALHRQLEQQMQAFKTLAGKLKV